MEAHSLYSGFKLPFLTYANSVHLKGLNLFSATYLFPLSLASIIIFNFIDDLFQQLANVKLNCLERILRMNGFVTNALELGAACLHKG